MTEQPVESLTEQRWLGNAAPAPAVTEPPPAQHIGPARLNPPAPRHTPGPLAAKFLGVIDTAFDKADRDLAGRRATDSGLLRLAADVEAAADPGRRMPLDQHAEIAAGNAADALAAGELDEGIAWLQSALAFAQNHRRAARPEGAAL